jgi:hypothetical protein
VYRLVFAVPFLSLCLSAADEVPALEFAPPGTRAIIGLHLREVIDSPLVRGLTKELSQGAPGMWSFSSPFPGVNPLKDIDEVVIVSTLEGEKPKGLVICRGRFPAEELEKGADRYRGVPIRQGQSGSGTALVDRGTMLAGDIRDVRAAIDRRDSHTAGVDPALAERAGRLSSRYAVWGAGAMPKGYHVPTGSSSMPASLDQFDFGIALRPGLELFATLHLGDPEDVKKLESAMEFFKVLSKGQMDSGGAKLETHVDHGTMTFSLRVPAEVLEKAIAQQGVNLTKALAQAATGAVPKPPSVPHVTETKIVSDERGNSVVVTLPGKQ